MQLAQAAQPSSAASSVLSDSVAAGGNLEQIKALLREREPKLDELLTEAMRGERALQKTKDTKILQILQFKDQQLGEMTQALADAKLLQATLAESQEKLAVAESQLSKL